jgi:hypothetical protein
VTPPESVLARLQFLVRVARKESMHLQSTDSRIFAEHFGSDRAKNRVPGFSGERSRVTLQCNTRQRKTITHARDFQA